MAFYEYKRVRDKLIHAGWMNEYAEPIDKGRYGEDMDPGYDGNLHAMSADYITHLEKQSAKLREALDDLLGLTENERPDWQHEEQDAARVALEESRGA